MRSKFVAPGSVGKRAAHVSKRSWRHGLTAPLRSRLVFRQSPDKKGIALVAVLWVITIAGLILIGVQKTARIGSAMATSELQTVQAHWLARAGLEQAIAVIIDDTAGVDAKNDLWYDDPLSFEQIELADGFVFDVLAAPTEEDSQQITTLVRYGLTDAASRLNINVADAGQLAQLLQLTDEQVAAILDWRDPDSKVSPLGAERGHYAQLDLPYNIRNGALATLNELLLIRGIDRTIFYGEDINRNGLLDANENDGEMTYPSDNADGVLQPGLAGLATIYSFAFNQDAAGRDRVNLNEADNATLTKQLNLTDALAAKVVQRRNSNTFKSIFELLNVKSDKPAPAQVKGQPKKINEFTIEWIARVFDQLTLTKDKRIKGLININTADRVVLMTLPQINEQIADKLIQYRSSAQGPVRTIGQLFISKMLNEKQFRAVSEKLTVRSNVFEVTSRGRRIGGITQTIYAVVERTDTIPRIIYWHQSE